MQETLTLTDLDQLKAIADPLRQRMLEAICHEPMTMKQVAEQLGENPTKLYHHLNVLEAAGLVKLIETRQNRGTVEKYYKASAAQFVVDHRLLALSEADGEGALELQSLIVNVLEAGLSEARRRLDTERAGIGPAHPTIVAGQTRIRTSQDKATKLAKDLQSWLSDFQSAHDEQGDVNYSVTVAFHPVKSSQS